MSKISKTYSITLKPKVNYPINGLPLDLLFGLHQFNQTYSLYKKDLPYDFYKLSGHQGIKINIKDKRELFILLEDYLNTYEFDIKCLGQFLDSTSQFYKIIKDDKIDFDNRSFNYEIDLSEYKTNNELTVKCFISEIFNSERFLNLYNFHVSIFSLLKGQFILKDEKMCFELGEDAIVYETLLKNYSDKWIIKKYIILGDQAAYYAPYIPLDISDLNAYKGILNNQMQIIASRSGMSKSKLYGTQSNLVILDELSSGVKKDMV